MNDLSKKNSNQPKGISFILIAAVILLLVLIVWLAYRYNGEENFVVVKSYGKGNIVNFSKNFNMIGSPSKDTVFGAILAEKEDVLGFNDTSIFLDNIEKNSLVIDESEEDIVYINSKVNTLFINNKKELLPWFQKMKDVDIENLGTLHFESEIPTEYIPYLKKIASHKPTINLIFENEEDNTIVKDYLAKAAFFNPSYVYATLNQNQFDLLQHFKSLKCLYLQVKDSVITTPLPEITALKQCIINDYNSKSIHRTFFDNNQQIEKVNLTGCLTEYSFLESLENLSQLIIMRKDCDTAGDLAPLKNKLPNLSVLILSGSFNSVGLISECKNLRWLGFPENTSQSQFDSITSQLTDLQIIEIQGNKTLKSLASLKQLSNLKGLTITGELKDTKTIYDLKSLKYLSIPEKNMTDSTTVQKLKKSLPGTIIVPNKGFCMGSGWLILLLPLIVIFYFLSQRKQTEKLKNEE